MCIKMRHFTTKWSKIFWGESTAPPQTPLPVVRGTPAGRGTLPPRTSPTSAPAAPRSNGALIRPSPKLKSCIRHWSWVHLQLVNYIVCLCSRWNIDNYWCWSRFYFSDVAWLIVLTKSLLSPTDQFPVWWFEFTPLHAGASIPLGPVSYTHLTLPTILRV